jgi:nucleoside-diphosphate-sugar epimerase
MIYDFQNKNILVTGGLGFVGSNLSIRLAELDANVLIVDNMLPRQGSNMFNIEPLRIKSVLIYLIYATLFQ